VSASNYDRRERARLHRAGRAARIAAPRSEPEEPTERRSWIGVDLARFQGAPRSRTLVPLIALALVVALGVAALRIDLIRTRYAVAASLDQEQTLIEEQRALIVRLRALRDPSVLAALARKRGYRPAERVIVLADPMPGPRATTDPAGDVPFTRGFARAALSEEGTLPLPAVAAPPPGWSTPAPNAEGGR